MRKALASLVMMFGLMCSGQEVVTNYIYTVNEVTNYVYTVSNITHITYNEITQKVTRAYNYYSTNFTYNVETNLYIDTLIGTNIATNVEMTVNITTNLTLYQTNFIDQINRTYNYHTTYQTNVNIYIDTWQNVYQTNYTTEVTLTNFEGYVEQCENIISNGTEYIDEYVSSMTNDVNEAMLYAYICNEAALRLASTNAVIFTTNSIPWTDYLGVEHQNILCLACNNMNGVIQASPPSGYESLGAATSIHIGTDNNQLGFQSSVFQTNFISHAQPTEVGMVVIYVPGDIITKESLRPFASGLYKYHIDMMYWATNQLISVSSIYNSEGEFLSTISKGEYMPNWPSAFGTRYSLNISYNGYTTTVYYRMTSIPFSSRLYVKSFPFLYQWKYLWSIMNVTGFHLR